MSKITIRVTFESGEGQIITHQQMISEGSLRMAYDAEELVKHGSAVLVSSLFSSIREEGFDEGF